MQKTFNISLFLFFIISTISCKYGENCKTDNLPVFNEDSAFYYIEKQVSFGSRIPNTPAQDSCADFLQNKLLEFDANVIIQNTNVKRFDGEILNISNIIAEFYPEKERRILLFAHWDSRYFADLETDFEKKEKPILGANDGASGVAVLLEIARIISVQEPEVGIDIIFFDGEDQGQPLYMNIYDEKAWCLGVQYWGQNPHKENYDALYGIGLDMVGTPNATFSREDNSRFFNNPLVKKTWQIAVNLGYEEYFIEDLSKPILHDHVFVSQMTGIRSILIIDNNRNKAIPYFDNWHTHNDNLENIDKNTLKVVGQTLITLIYCQK